MQFMQSIGPSAIDAEIRSLSPDLGGDLLLMKQFMEFLDSQLASRRDFEVTEAYMALFLKVRCSHKVRSLFPRVLLVSLCVCLWLVHRTGLCSPAKDCWWL